MIQIWQVLHLAPSVIPGRFLQISPSQSKCVPDEDDGRSAGKPTNTPNQVVYLQILETDSTGKCIKVFPEAQLNRITREQTTAASPGGIVPPVHSGDIRVPRPAVGQNLIATPYHNLIAVRP